MWKNRNPEKISDVHAGNLYSYKWFDDNQTAFSNHNFVYLTTNVRPQAQPQEKLSLHEQWEMGVVLEGEYLDVRGRSRIRLKPGDMWWCGPWELHGYAFPRPRSRVFVADFMPLILYNIPQADPFSSVACVPFLRPEVRPQLQPRTPAARQAILRQVQAVLAADSPEDPYFRTAVRMEFLKLLMLGMREYAVPAAGDLEVPKHNPAERMLKVVQYARQHLAMRISLEQAAEHICMSRTRFALAFKKVMGISFARYMMRARLEKAHEEIRQGRLKISIIAERCGFTDPSHLIKQYRRYFGHTPGREKLPEYRTAV